MKLIITLIVVFALIPVFAVRTKMPPFSVHPAVNLAKSIPLKSKAASFPFATFIIPEIVMTSPGVMAESQTREMVRVLLPPSSSLSP